MFYEEVDLIIKIITSIIVILFALDGLRFVIALFGIVPRNGSRLSKIIYRNTEIELLKATFRELGFKEIISKRLSDKLIDNQISSLQKEFKKAGENLEKNLDYSKHLGQLVALLGNCTLKFFNPVQYSKNTISKSSYYINTMEISRDQKLLNQMASHLKFLIDSVLAKRPTIIFSPKGGNPTLARKVAELYGAHLIIVKQNEDKSRVSVNSKNIDAQIFKVNYEGSGIVNWRKEHVSIIIDCNTSGGSQLLSIIEELGEINVDFSVPIPSDVFVLFRADEQGIDIDQKFKDKRCQLHRYFDLNEPVKEKLYELKTQCYINQKSYIDFYNDKHSKKIAEFIENLELKFNLNNQ